MDEKEAQAKFENCCEKLQEEIKKIMILESVNLATALEKILGPQCQTGGYQITKPSDTSTPDTPAPFPPTIPARIPLEFNNITDSLPPGSSSADTYSPQIHQESNRARSHTWSASTKEDPYELSPHNEASKQPQPLPSCIEALVDCLPFLYFFALHSDPLENKMAKQSILVINTKDRSLKLFTNKEQTCFIKDLVRDRDKNFFTYDPDWISIKFSVKDNNNHGCPTTLYFFNHRESELASSLLCESLSDVDAPNCTMKRLSVPLYFRGKSKLRALCFVQREQLVVVHEKANNLQPRLVLPFLNTEVKLIGCHGDMKECQKKINCRQHLAIYTNLSTNVYSYRPPNKIQKSLFNVAKSQGEIDELNSKADAILGMFILAVNELMPNKTLLQSKKLSTAST